MLGNAPPETLHRMGRSLYPPCPRSEMSPEISEMRRTARDSRIALISWRLIPSRNRPSAVCLEYCGGAEY